MSELRNQTTMDDFLPGGEATGNREQGTGMAMADPAGADEVYTGIPDGDAARLRYLAAGIRADFDGARERVLHAGMLLAEAQNRCPRGRWLEWLKAEARIPERSAQQAMQLYSVYGARELPSAYESLDASHLVELLRAPDDARDDMAARAADESLSVRQLKAEIKALNEARAKDQLTIEGLTNDRAEANRKIYDLSQQGEAAERAIRAEREAAERARKTAEEAEKTADEMRKVSSRAANEASQSSQRAADAVQRANEAVERLRAAEARIAELESAPPATVEVERAPEAVTHELEALRAEVARLRAEAEAPRTDPDAEADRRRLAMALRVRFAAQDVRTHLREAVEAAQTAMRATMIMLDQLRALDPQRAGALEDECRAVARWAQDCADAEVQG